MFLCDFLRHGDDILFQVVTFGNRLLQPLQELIIDFTGSLFDFQDGRPVELDYSLAGFGDIIFEFDGCRRSMVERAP